ncbi:alpha/beta fold hydrolase [Verrucomicrobia bacterium S94]|nr:alpha/beta fold hydrolase [Verrucomicrobia bacterium S94]
MATLTQASTVSDLAKIIGGEKSSTDVEGCRSLKCIQSGHKGKAPLFMVHGGAGNTLIFKDLARNLGAEWPVYAFQWSGWDGLPGETSIESMASVYVEELLSVADDGPFYLGGHCIGGLIALEMGRLLKSRGIAFKEPLLITDSPNIRSRKYLPRNRNRRRFDTMRTKLLEKKITDCEVDSLSDAHSGSGLKGWIKDSRLYAYVRNLRTEKRIMAMHEQAGKGKPVPVDSRAFYSGQMMHLALRAYKGRKYEGAVLYFRSGCHGDRMHLSGWWDDVFLGFEELCSGRFTGYVIGGGHDEILSRPELEGLLKDVWET